MTAPVGTEVLFATAIVFTGIAIKAVLAWCNHGAQFDARLTIRSSIMGILGGFGLVFGLLQAEGLSANFDNTITMVEVMLFVNGVMAVIGTDKIAKDVGIQKKPVEGYKL